MSHENGGSYVMDRKGSFRFVQGHTSSPIGTEIECKDRSPRSYLKIAAMVACFVLITAFGSFAWLWTSESHSIYVDVNPSVELVFNRLNRLHTIRPINEAGEALFRDLNLRGTPEEVLLALIHELKQAEDPTMTRGSLLLITFSDSPGTSEAGHSAAIAAALERYGMQDLNVFMTYGGDYRYLARYLEVSPGRLSLAQRLYRYDSTAKLEDFLCLPLEELLKATAP